MRLQRVLSCCVLMIIQADQAFSNGSYNRQRHMEHSDQCILSIDGRWLECPCWSVRSPSYQDCCHMCEFVERNGIGECQEAVYRRLETTSENNCFLLPKNLEGRQTWTPLRPEIIRPDSGQNIGAQGTQSGADYPDFEPDAPQNGADYPDVEPDAPENGADYPDFEPDAPENGADYPDFEPDQNHNGAEGPKFETDGIVFGHHSGRGHLETTGRHTHGQEEAPLPRTGTNNPNQQGHNYGAHQLMAHAEQEFGNKPRSAGAHSDLHPKIRGNHPNGAEIPRPGTNSHAREHHYSAHQLMARSENEHGNEPKPGHLQAGSDHYDVQSYGLCTNVRCQRGSTCVVMVGQPRCVTGG